MHLSCSLPRVECLVFSRGLGERKDETSAGRILSPQIVLNMTRALKFMTHSMKETGGEGCADPPRRGLICLVIRLWYAGRPCIVSYRIVSSVTFFSWYFFATELSVGVLLLVYDSKVGVAWFLVVCRGGRNYVHGGDEKRCISHHLPSTQACLGCILVGICCGEDEEISTLPGLAREQIVS